MYSFIVHLSNSNNSTSAITLEKIKKIYGRPDIGSSGPNGVMQVRGGIFYDLGSGTGKAVIAAALMHNFAVCCGIELLEGLHTISLEIQNEYNIRVRSKFSHAFVFALRQRKE